MLVNTRVVRIEWGDCDPAGIVFYPRYFAIFDACTIALFERALAMTMREMCRLHDCVGFPMVDTRARFLIPSRFGDEVAVETRVTAFRRSSFDVHHRLLLGGEGGRLAVEGFETRVWTAVDPEDPERIKARALPTAVVEALGGRPGAT
jgi:4-hydroxybenzoyl-CoA thioesterase